MCENPLRYTTNLDEKYLVINVVLFFIYFDLHQYQYRNTYVIST
jgi:hypothetical protein